MNRRSFLTRLASAIAVPLFVPEHAIRSILDNRIVLPPEPRVLVPAVATIGPGRNFSTLWAWQDALLAQCPDELDKCYTAECYSDVEGSLNTADFPKTSAEKHIVIRGGRDMPSWSEMQIVPRIEW